jgi:predicted N-acyltransferase
MGNFQDFDKFSVIADNIMSKLLNNFSILKRAGLEVEPILGANLTILILKEFFHFPRESHTSPLSAAVPAHAPFRLTIGNCRISFPGPSWHDPWINSW